MTDIIVLPGIGGSGASHWQTRWEDADPRMRRFAPASWDHPALDDWIAALDTAIDAGEPRPLLLAHSLACLLVAHWQRVSSRTIAGAYLVAVPDPDSTAFPAEAAAFAKPPENRFDFPSLVVASSDDPYASLPHVHTWAAQWGAAVVEIGARGHINGSSGLADWPEGRNLLTAFMAGIR
jgi:uncharacterized protein